MRSACDVCLDNASLYTGRSCWLYERFYICLPCFFFVFFFLPTCHLPFIIYFIRPAVALYGVFACTECNEETVRLVSPSLCLLRLSLWIDTANTSPIARCLLPLHALCTIHLNLPAPTTFLTEFGGSIVITWVISWIFSVTANVKASCWLRMRISRTTKTPLCRMLSFLLSPLQKRRWIDGYAAVGCIMVPEWTDGMFNFG